MPLPGLPAFFRRPAVAAALAGAGVFAAGAGMILKGPRPSKATATVALESHGLPPVVTVALPNLDASLSPTPAAVLSEPVLRITVWGMGEKWWPGLAGKDAVELAASDAGETGEKPRKALVDRGRLDAAVDEARASLLAEAHPDLGEIAITATNRKADRAKALADATAVAFAEWAAYDARQRSQRAAVLLKAQQDAAIRKMTDVEEQIAKLRPEVLPDELLELKRPNTGVSLERRAGLEAKLGSVEAEHRDLSSKVNDPNFTFVVDVDDDKEVQVCLSEVLRAQTRQADLEQRLGANDAQTKAAKAEVENWGTQLKSARSRAVTSMSAKERMRSIDRIRALGEQRESLRQELEALDTRIAKESKEWTDLVTARVAAKKGASTPAMTELTADAGLWHKRFTDILAARFAVEGAPSAIPVRVASTARAVPGGPPDWALWSIAAALAALAAGGSGYLVGRGRRPRPASMRGTIRTEHDLGLALKIPVLGCTPRAPAAQLMLHHVDARHPFAEAYNTVAALVESYAADHAARTFMITSASPGDGKTTLAANLGIALARSGQRVILIDADMRKGRLHEIFGLGNERGTSEAGWDESGQPIIVEVDALLKDTSDPGLRLIPCGPPPPNPVALLKGSAFKAMLAEAAQKADYILIDVPPVLAAVDPLLLTATADGILFVAAADETKREDVVYAKKLLENTHGRFAGGVLTKAGDEAREIPAYEVEAKEKQA